MEAERIYLDYAATSPIDARVAHHMAEVMAMPLGNAASLHSAGLAAEALVEKARAQVAALIGARPEEITFTSGATESNNLAITGTARVALARVAREQAAGARVAAPHVITLATEHKSVLETVRALQGQGVTVSILKPGPEGLLDPAVLAAELREETVLVSLLHVNNETGVMQDVPALAAVCAARRVPLHLDASQSAGKLPVSTAGLALLSFTAHKLGGPQGIGALWVSPTHRARLAPQMLGGSHERGLRAGTLPVHQIAGFGLAAELAAAAQPSESRRIAALRDRLWQGLRDLPGVLLNGHTTARAPHVLNISFTGVEGESLYMALPQLLLSTGSACSSRSNDASFVLRALGRDTEQAQSALRFSFGHETTEAEIDRAIAAVRGAHAKLLAMSPAFPPPVQDWSEADAQIMAGEGGELRQGAWVRFLVRVDSGVIQEARAQVYGCPHTIAASSHVQGQLAGGRVEAIPGTPEQWRIAVNAPVEKLGRMLIIEDALRALRPLH